ncbi:MAG: alginate export family protein [Planctomycetes bacterium]|nr:alginate export family protein [Planctomycetota bacterium]
MSLNRTLLIFAAMSCTITGTQTRAETPMDQAPIVKTGWVVEPLSAENQKEEISTTPTTAPAEPAKILEPAPCLDGCSTAFDFKKVPPVRITPRTGNFPIPPKGCGYYSVLDQMRGTLRDAPSKYPYPPFGLMQPSFADADFRYLDDLKNTDTDYLDCLKRIHVGDNWLFSTGGQVWNRVMNEQNSRLGLVNNNYDLLRVRTYGDLWYKDQFRIYAEFISASSFWQNLPPLRIDQNPADFQNLFFDAKLMDLNNSPVYARVGRQEILLGSQRLVSTLDWANTRRTFDGARVFRQGEKFDVDLFWLQPVVPNPQGWSSVDNNQNFAGAWTTYRPKKGTFLDLYYLFLDNTGNLTQQGITRAPFSIHTIGTRFAGDQNNFLWDVELAGQFGSRGNENVAAGMATVGGGYNFAKAPWNPTFWIYYDYASGDRNPNSGTYNTFNQLFPFGHYYFGWADQVGRQNIQDLNLHLYLYPTHWMQIQMQYHHFNLASSRDALYNAAGNAIRRSATGAAGTDVGDEFDLIMNFHLSKHSDILMGYSKLFGGNFLQQTAGRTGSTNTDLFFVQYSYKW